LTLDTQEAGLRRWLQSTNLLGDETPPISTGAYFRAEMVILILPVPSGRSAL